MAFPQRADGGRSCIPSKKADFPDAGAATQIDGGVFPPLCASRHHSHFTGLDYKKAVAGVAFLKADLMGGKTHRLKRIGQRGQELLPQPLK